MLFNVHLYRGEMAPPLRLFEPLALQGVWLPLQGHVCVWISRPCDTHLNIFNPSMFRQCTLNVNLGLWGTRTSKIFFSLLETWFSP